MKDEKNPSIADDLRRASSILNASMDGESIVLSRKLRTHAATIQELERDAARWQMLPAFLEKYQLDYMALIADIDAAILKEKPNV